MADEAMDAAAEKDQAAPDTGGEVVDAEKYRRMLSTIRRRRMYFLGVIAIYLPMMWVVLQFTRSYRGVGTVFVIWFVALFAAGLVSAAAPCPRCGNYFHVHGMTLLYLRKCLHCQLHINADRKL